MEFKELKIENLNINPCQMIGQEWMLIAAGKENSYNAYRSWGILGRWGKHVKGPTVEIFSHLDIQLVLLIIMNVFLCHSLKKSIKRTSHISAVILVKMKIRYPKLT